ncbi:MAG TPA: TolC family protein, partial [bacterium]|nr:TolC family protein [bacterium]
MKPITSKQWGGVRISLLRFSLTLVVGFLTVSGAIALYAQEQPTEDLQQGETLTLPQAIRIALANNRDIKRSLLTVEEAETQVTTAWSQVIPRISTSMTYTRNVEVPVFFIPADFTDPNAPLVPVRTGTDNNWSGSVSVTQTIFRGEALVGISSATLFRTVQSESFRATAQQVVTQTRLAYYQVLIAQQRLQLQQATIDRLESNLAQNRSRYKAGLLDEYDVLQLEVQLANERPNLQDAQYAIQQAHRNLSLALGLPLQYEFQVEGNLRSFTITTQSTTDQENAHIKQIDRVTPIVLEPEEPFIQQAFAMRGDLRTLRAQLELKNREILGIRARYLPDISATYNLQWNAAEADEPDFFGTEQERARSQAVALSISLPIFQGFS